MILLRKLWPQPVIAVVSIGAVASCISIAARVHANLSDLRSPLETGILGVCLAAATALAYRYPIHIRHNLKMYMATVPIFLIAVSASPVTAAVIAGVAVAAGEAGARSQTGAYVSDMFTSAARYALITLLVSSLIHVTWISNYPARLVAASLVYWVLEAVTLPLVISPVNGEPPLQVTKAFVRQVGVAEAAQYGVGILGGLIADRYPLGLILLVIPAALVYTAFKSAKEMHESTLQMLESMADAVDLRDPYTGGHSRRVAEYTAAILHQLDKGGPEAHLVVSAARVHDIGKIGLPDSVLLKDGQLTPSEQAIMQSHPDAGAQLLRRYREFVRGIEIVRHHHERWDGLGYPAKLKGQNIPFGARIVAVADSFDAMTSDRPYRKGMSQEMARAILLQGRGSQWDVEVVDAFMKVLDTRASRASEGVEQAVPILRTAAA